LITVDFLAKHPTYIILLIFCLIAVVKVIIDIARGYDEKDNRDNSDNDDGGLEYDENPTLDLPPGVTLPVGPKELVEA